MLTIWQKSALLLLTMSISGWVFSEPYLAQRYGQKCSTCHVNVTGGGMRTQAGSGYASALTSTPVNSSFSPQLNDAISIGADFRAGYNYTQFDEPEPTGNGNQDSDIADTSAFSTGSGNLYFGFNFSENFLMYLDQQFAPEGGRTREAFGLFRNAGFKNTYFKVGKFFLPYGLRLQDDRAFIREATGFNFDNSDIGMEYGYEAGPWSTSISLTNGTQGAGENNTDKQVAVMASYIKSIYRVGASYSTNNAPNGLGQDAQNIFAGLTLGKWVFLAELDRVKERDSTAETDTNKDIAFFSVNYLVQPSLNLKFSYDYLDPSTDIDENQRTRYSLVAEKFLNQYAQIRGGARLYEGIPQATIENQDSLFVELHLYF